MRFQNSKTGKVIVPLDEKLDLPNGDVTVSLARRALRLSTCMSFGELQTELVAQHVRLTDSTLDTLMRQAGGVAVADRGRELDALASTPRGLRREQRVSACDSSKPLAAFT